MSWLPVRAWPPQVVSLVSDARHRRGGAGSGGEFLLPAFNVPKGIEPLLSLYQHALLNGTPIQREV